MDDATPQTLIDDIGQALVGDVDPVRLEGFSFAQQILPAFRLIRALFSQSELDTCLKLMLLFELTRAGGRSTLERIRSLTAFLEPGRVDALVKSLREGGWLELRASDNTYVVSSVGLNLLAVLYAANLGNLTPANALARAAQNAAFGATLEGAEGATAYLLDQLLTLLQDQVEESRAVLQFGRAHRMVAWSQREHGRQLEIIKQVLGALQERMDASGREFSRIVRLHEAMQEIIGLHSSLHTRLRDWNLERLYSSEAGYSIPQLAEAIMGVDETTLQKALDRGLLKLPIPTPSLTVDELRTRFHGARRRLASQEESFEYAPPDAPELRPWTAADLDPASALRARLTQALAGRTPSDPPLELESWIDADRHKGTAFAGTAYELAILSQLQVQGPRLVLDDGRLAELRLKTDGMSGISPAQLLTHLETVEALRRLPGGLFAHVTLALVAEDVASLVPPKPEDSRGR